MGRLPHPLHRPQGSPGQEPATAGRKQKTHRNDYRDHQQKASAGQVDTSERHPHLEQVDYPAPFDHRHGQHPDRVPAESLNCLEGRQPAGGIPESFSAERQPS